MADESDYTKMWSGVFTPPRIGDDDRGIYLLDDESSVGRNNSGAAFYDSTTRVLYEDAHPRARPSRPPYGAGRASIQVGPTFSERHHDLRRGSAQFAGEGFVGGSPDERAAYIQGSRVLGHPGPRGMVTSSREGRPAIDGVMWDNRPPHFAPDSPNEYAHLYIDPEARGPALFSKDPTYPGFHQVDRFIGEANGVNTTNNANGPTCRTITLRDSLEIVKTVMFVILVILVAMCLMVTNSVSRAEKRINRELKLALQRRLVE